MEGMASGRLLLPVNPEDPGVLVPWGQSYTVAVMHSDDDCLRWRMQDFTDLRVIDTDWFYGA